jgi:hypothetical protein
MARDRQHKAVDSMRAASHTSAGRADTIVLHFITPIWMNPGRPRENKCRHV